MMFGWTRWKERERKKVSAHDLILRFLLSFFVVVVYFNYLQILFIRTLANNTIVFLDSSYGEPFFILYQKTV